MEYQEWRPRAGYLAAGIFAPFLLWLFGVDWGRRGSPPAKESESLRVGESERQNTNRPKPIRRVRNE